MDSAIREYREAKRLDPTRIDVRENLAWDLGGRDRAAGIKEFQELIAIAPDFALAHAGLANVFLLNADYKGAEAECQKAIELDPSSADSFTILGQALEGEGRYTEAVAAYLRAKTFAPDEDTPRRLLGRTYFEQKMYAQAIEELRIATHLKPMNPKVTTLLGQALEAKVTWMGPSPNTGKH